MLAVMDSMAERMSAKMGLAEAFHLGRKRLSSKMYQRIFRRIVHEVFTIIAKVLKE